MRYLLILTSLGLLLIGVSFSVFAHGARVTYSIESVVNIQAMYDSGEAMAEAQVVVYAPNDPTNPWLTGSCDSEGRFQFKPDPAIPGIWDVQVRSAGHGDMIHIDLSSSTSAAESSSTPLQTILMGACVIWGFIGTALFFSRRSKGA